MFGRADKGLKVAPLFLTGILLALAGSACDSAKFEGHSANTAKRSPAPQDDDATAQPKEGDDVGPGDNKDANQGQADENPSMNDGEQTGEGETVAAPTASEPLQHTLKVACSDNDAKIHEIHHKAGQAVNLSVEGELCVSRPRETLTVVLVVDISSSNFPAEGWPGNDPLVNGTCGRHAAVTSVVTKLQAQLPFYEAIDVRVVLFNGQAQALNPVKLDSTKPQLAFAPSDLCLGIGQTNYEAAFSVAKAQLAAAPAGKKLLYFLSDGLPQPAETGPKAVRIGEELRQTYSDLAMMAVLLGSTGAQASNLLAQITGSPDNVKRANTAADLPKQIVDFKLAEYTKGGLSLHFAELDKVVGLSELKGSFPSWTWRSEPLLLDGAALSEHHVTINAKDQAGLSSARKLQINLITDPN